MKSLKQERNNCWGLLLCLLLFSSGLAAQTGIRIEINRLRNNNGHVLVSLFREGVGFPDKPENAIRKAKLSVSNKQAWVLFTDLPAGNYAVAILHDENDDQKMNKTMLGLPAEGYGFSNNVMGAFGPPSWSRARFRYAGNTITIQSIRTRY